MRLALSEEEWSSKSQAICDNFFSSIDLIHLFTIHVYLPLASKKEPDTQLIIDKLQKDFPEIRISIPRIENDQLVNFYYEGVQQLETNEWGISEPKFGEPTPTEKIDLVIVPLLAFDSMGNRVGYGKGFYDQFLKQCRPDSAKVGLSFFESMSEQIPAEVHDMKLNEVMNPYQAISFK